MHFSGIRALHLLLVASSLSTTFLETFAQDQQIFDTNLDWGTIPTNMGLLNEKEYDAAPSNLKLEQVHVYVRHGERTPVGIRMADAPANIPAFWNFCKTARRIKAAVAGSNNSSEIVEVLRLSERRDGHAQEGECSLGELTDVGRKVTQVNLLVLTVY